MKQMLHPHYQVFKTGDLRENQEKLRRYEKPEGLFVEERTIPGLNSAPDIEIKIFRPEHAPTGSPMVMDVHGGGFVRGHYNMDNHRNTYIAMHVPAIVVAINYRLSPTHIYPAALEDCRSVWAWMHEHSEELGGDRERMGLIGNSAGGNLCAALAFYIRDHGGPKISLNVLNFPTLDLGWTVSAEQMRDEAPTLCGKDLAEAYKDYLGGFGGELPSYYVLPNRALDFTGLPATLVIAAEYDPLRDEAIDYARKLMRDAVPVELYVVPRVGHGYDLVKDAPMSRWAWQGIAMSCQREFGMLQANMNGEPDGKATSETEKTLEERGLY